MLGYLNSFKNIFSRNYRIKFPSLAKRCLYGEQYTNSLQQSDQPASSSTSSQMTGTLNSGIQKAAAPKPTEKPMTPQVSVMSRPSSAPLVPGPRPTSVVVSMAQATPFLARSVSAAGRLGPEPSPTASYVPQSYRNAIMGNHVASSSAGFTHPNTPTSGVNPLPAYSQPPAYVSAPVYIPQSSDRMEPNSIQSGFPFGMVTRDTLPNGPQFLERSQRGGSTSPSVMKPETTSLPSIQREHLEKKEEVQIMKRKKEKVQRRKKERKKKREGSGLKKNRLPDMALFLQCGK